MVVVANRAVFTNGMMGVVEDPQRPGQFTLDNDNWGFTTRTIQWLKGGAGEPRTACLFVQDGRVIDRFAVELPGMPPPPMPNIPPDVIANWVLNHANAIIDEKQQDDVFNQAVAQISGWARLLRAFLILATLALALVGLRWLIRGRRKAEPAAVLTPSARDSLSPGAGCSGSGPPPRSRWATCTRRPGAGSASGLTCWAAGPGRPVKCPRS